MASKNMGFLCNPRSYPRWSTGSIEFRCFAFSFSFVYRFLERQRFFIKLLGFISPSLIEIQKLFWEVFSWPNFCPRDVQEIGLILST